MESSTDMIKVLDLSNLSEEERRARLKAFIQRRLREDIEKSRAASEKRLKEKLQQWGWEYKPLPEVHLPRTQEEKDESFRLWLIKFYGRPER